MSLCNITVDSGNSKRLNSKQSLISKHFWWNWAIVLYINYMLNSKHLSLVNHLGDKTEFTITRVHCIWEWPKMKNITFQMLGVLRLVTFLRIDGHCDRPWKHHLKKHCFSSENIFMENSWKKWKMEENVSSWYAQSMCTKIYSMF